MPRNNGVATLPPVTWATPGTTIRAQQHNDPMRDIAAMLTNSLPRDGSAPMNGNLPMAGRRITNMGAATQPGDAARFDQLPATSGWLQSVAALVMLADRLPYATGSNTAALTVLTAFARSFLDDADATEGRATLGLTAVQAVIDLLNAALAHDNAAWQSGTATAPGLPTPAQIRQAANVAISSSSIGYNQTWQVVTRTSGQVYRNETSRPIMINVDSTGANTALFVGVANPPTVRVAYNQSSGSGALESMSISAIIPQLHYYRITGGYGDVVELR